MVGNGDVLPGRTEMGMVRSADELAEQAQTVLKRVEALLSEQTVENVQASTADARKLMRELSDLAARQKRELAELNKSLRQSSEGLQRITSSVERTTGEFERLARGPELERSIKRVDSLTARMDEASATLERSTRSLDSVLARMERGEGTLGKLMRDEALYANLNDAALNFSRLAEDIRKQPKRYVKLSLF
jgi:phospholipid/cholesterol/gamma-HCH transport system substrate-binding protein